MLKERIENKEFIWLGSGGKLNAANSAFGANFFSSTERDYGIHGPWKMYYDFSCKLWINFKICQKLSYGDVNNKPVEFNILMING